MPHTVDAVSDESRCCRRFLLHSKRLHAVLFTLLVIDGLICLTCGVLETQFLNGKVDDYEAFVNTCTSASVAHRRLDSPPLARLKDAWISAAAQATTPRMLSDEDAGHGSNAGHASNAGHGSNAGHSSNAGHGSNAGHASNAGHGSNAGHSTAASHASNSASHGSASGHSSCSHPHFGNHDLHTAEVNLAYVSIGILCVFLLEQLVLIAELRAEYLKPMFVLDFVVIVSSLAIELLVVNMSMGGLLVLARTWRFARVGHGAIASEEKINEINEDDESVAHLNEAWTQLPDERWNNIAKGKVNCDETEWSSEELKIAEELGKSPYVALRALALARAYNTDMTEKAEKARKTGKKGPEGLAWIPVPKSNTPKKEKKIVDEAHI